MNQLKLESKIYRLRGLTPMLGSQPASKEIFTQYIASKAPQPEMEGDVIAALPEDRGTTVFCRNPKDELCLRAHQIKGFFKEALLALQSQTGIAMARSKVDTLVFIDPWLVPIRRNGETLMEEDEILERPLRTDNGPAGPRSALTASEMIYDPWEVEFELTLMHNAGTKKSPPLTYNDIEMALDYGAYHGLQQWRNAGYGSFRWEEVKED